MLLRRRGGFVSVQGLGSIGGSTPGPTVNGVLGQTTMFGAAYQIATTGAPVTGSTSLA